MSSRRSWTALSARSRAWRGGPTRASARSPYRPARATAVSCNVEAFGSFPKCEAIEIHLATNFQNIVFDHPNLPADLRRELQQWVKAECKDEDRKSTRLNSSHGYISYAVFCLKKKKKIQR